MEAQAGEADPRAKVGEVGCGTVCDGGTGQVHGVAHCRLDQRGKEEPWQEAHVLRRSQLGASAGVGVDRGGKLPVVWAMLMNA